MVSKYVIKGDSQVKRSVVIGTNSFIHSFSDDGVSRTVSVTQRHP